MLTAHGFFRAMLKLQLISGGRGFALPLAELPVKRVLVIARGGGSALVDKVRGRFALGDVFFLDVPGTFEVLEGEIAAAQLISLDVAYLEYFLLQYPLARGLGLFVGGGMVTLSKPALGVLLERVRLLHGDIEQGLGFDHLKLSLAMCLLNMVSHLLEPARPFEEGRRLMGMFKELLEANFRGKQTRRSSFYAEQMRISQRRLNALCRVWYQGRGFDGVVLDRLLSEAEYLLAGTQEPIKNIYIDLDFYSQQHFRGWFKRHRGVSPTGFRAEAQKRG